MPEGISVADRCLQRLAARLRTSGIRRRPHPVRAVVTVPAQTMRRFPQPWPVLGLTDAEISRLVDDALAVS
jgi:hypothetical protein